jgi:daunorubicin resistance ABC transporter membrane protein
MAVATAELAGAVREKVSRQSMRHDLRAVKIVMHRELIRFWRDRLRMVAGLMQPVLYLLVLGTGLSSLVTRGLPGVNLRTFLFAGVIAMSVNFTALFSAGSIVWDREFGFLREMLVAPVSRTSIIVGKCLGGAVVASVQGLLILALAGFAKVPYSPTLLLTLLAEMFLTAFALTGFGVLLAVRIKSMQAFMGLMQMVMLPLLFTSGAMFPLSNLPSWLTVVTRLNPLTYAIDPMRHAIFSHAHTSPAVREILNPGVTWNGWRVPAPLELLIVLVLGFVLLGLSIVEFRRAD